MNDATKGLRAYYYGLLDGNVTYNSVEVPVVNKPRNDTDYPYITVSAISYVDDMTKTSYSGNHLINITVCTRFPINEGGQDVADDISNSVLGLVRNKGDQTTFDTFSVDVLKLTRTNSLEEDDENFYYYTKILVFECFVSEDI